MNPVEERPVLSITDSVADFRKGLISSLGRISARTNLQVPLDGSELTNQLSYPETFNTQITSDSHDLELDTDVAFNYITSDANNYVITGIANGASNDPGTGRVLHLLNGNVFTTYHFQLLHQSILSLPENRFINPGASTQALVNHGARTFYYDTSVLRWRMRV